MLSDAIKLLILALAVTACLCTLFTSPSTTTGNGSMKRLAPPVRQHCATARKSASKCSSESQAQCHDLEEVVLKCENAVKKAYQHINLGGCPFEIKALTLCEAEWCLMDDLASCDRECANVKESLSNCVQGELTSFFRRNGLEDNGTLKLN